MKRKKKILKRGEKGITLIALVITIIVLLILAGVSIAMLTGENGILSQAQKAKDETQNAQKEEENILDEYEIYIKNGTMETAAVGEIVVGGNKKYSNNGTAIIPEGFAIVPGLDNVEEGLVISDVANDVEDKGNQFVWVPVPEFSEFKRYDFQNDTEVSEEYTEDDGNGITDGTEAERMYKSVKENKGFYIGRYEAGNDGANNAISKKNVEPYRNIKWGNSMTDETGGAVEKARNFSTQSGHVNVTSTLVYVVQWDAIMRWLSKGNEEEQGWLKDSTGKGNYRDDDSSNNPSNTGVNDEYQMKNIYDLAGNVWEWTMEKYADSKRVERGGNYEPDTGALKPCSSWYQFAPEEKYPGGGFRIAFYL